MPSVPTKKSTLGVQSMQIRESPLKKQFQYFVNFLHEAKQTHITIYQ